MSLLIRSLSAFAHPQPASVRRADAHVWADLHTASVRAR
ncbi:hypothetical protein PS906_00812 [Pseudomonas fluorescens]|nr:hypothetical protein PS906_00812 [Pseudomonas fluorescens]